MSRRVYVGKEGLNALRTGQEPGTVQAEKNMREFTYIYEVDIDSRRITSEQVASVTLVTSYEDENGNVFDDAFGDIWLNENGISR